MNKPVLTAVLLPFSVLSAVAVWHHGYWGLLEPALHSWGAAQILMDLCIALALFIAWMWRDARRLGRAPWPWILLTLIAGSFGPLLYLLTRPARAAAS